MDAATFWNHLEYRVCREINGLRTDEHRGLWCDGFIPEDSHFDDGPPRVTGRVWMGRGPRHQEQWRFTLLLPADVTSEADVDWASIFPAEDVTGWLSLDATKREMRIDPTAAKPDCAPDED